MPYTVSEGDELTGDRAGPTRISPIVCAGARRRSVGLPGLKIWKPSSAARAAACGSGRRRRRRPRSPKRRRMPRQAAGASDPRRGASRCGRLRLAPRARPAAAGAARRCPRCRARPAPAGRSPRARAAPRRSTKSPAWSSRSAAAIRSTHASGSRRAPRGRCVSEMTAISMRGSTLDFTRARSSVDRALPSGGRSRRFESFRAYTARPRCQSGIRSRSVTDETVVTVSCEWALVPKPPRDHAMTLVLSAPYPERHRALSNRCVTYERGDRTIRYEDGHEFSSRKRRSSVPPGWRPSTRPGRSSERDHVGRGVARNTVCSPNGQSAQASGRGNSSFRASRPRRGRWCPLTWTRWI